MPRLQQLSAQRVALLRRSLQQWYRTHRRPLPWRRNRNSYRVWVAEVMLQQTRIAVVVPAYRRFLNAFPNLKSLASASEDEVLSHWSGLGYYSRARALRQAAHVLHTRGARSFPTEYELARRLPGVGPYTAAAVLSIAYDQPYAAVDGNVARVLSRLLCLPRAESNGEPYSSTATQLLDPQQPGDWNQALMELGEVVCTPAKPRCGSCPWRRVCVAKARNVVDRYPSPRRRRQRERLSFDLHLWRDRHGRLLLERGAFPLLPHLWLPPLVAVDSSRSENGRRTARGHFRHAILHRDLLLSVNERRLSAVELRKQLRPLAAGSERRLFDAAALARIGRSSLLTKALATIDGGKR